MFLTDRGMALIFDLALKDVGGLLSGSAAAIGIFITIRLNLGGTRAHLLASQAAALAEKLGAQLESATDDGRLSETKELRDQLVERSHEATRRYLSQTKPKRPTFFDIAGSTIIMMLFSSIFWLMFDVGEWQVARTAYTLVALALALGFLGLGILMVILTSRTKAESPATEDGSGQYSPTETPAGHEPPTEAPRESHELMS